MMFLRHDEFQEEEKYLKICSHPKLQHFFCQERGIFACRYCSSLCLWCRCKNLDTIIALFHHVVEVLSLECPLQYLLVPVDMPWGYLDFECVDGIRHVVVKLRAIIMPYNTSCKHGRHTFTHIYGMRCRVKFPWPQARVESFDVVCKFLSNPQWNILLLVILQIKICIVDQALICTFKRRNIYVRVISVIPLHLFRCKPTHWPHRLPHLTWRSVFSWCVGTHQTVVPWIIGVSMDVDICTWGWIQITEIWEG